MATIRREVIIDRSADDVWAVVGDVANTYRWFPGMVSSDVEGDVRTVVTAAGLTLPEQIVTIDPILRRFQYRVTAPIITGHLGTIDVYDLGDGRSLVSYGTDCEPAAMALMIGGAAGGALQELRRQLEAPSTPAPTGDA
jgi:hypothetical protein